MNKKYDKSYQSTLGKQGQTIHKSAMYWERERDANRKTHNVMHVGRQAKQISKKRGEGQEKERNHLW